MWKAYRGKSTGVNTFGERFQRIREEAAITCWRVPGRRSQWKRDARSAYLENHRFLVRPISERFRITAQPARRPALGASKYRAADVLNVKRLIVG